MRTARCEVSNMKVAETLGVHNSMVSRVRSGERFPSVALMLRIERVYKWPIDGQAKVLHTPDYSTHFEHALERHYDGGTP